MIIAALYTLIGVLSLYWQIPTTLDVVRDMRVTTGFPNYAKRRVLDRLLRNLVRTVAIPLEIVLGVLVLTNVRVVVGGLLAAVLLVYSVSFCLIAGLDYYQIRRERS